MDENSIRFRVDTQFESTPNSSNPGNDILGVGNKSDNINDIDTIRTRMESHIFRIGRTHDKAQDFMNERVHGWTHGVKPPYTVFKYEKAPIGNPKNIFNKAEKEKIFIPRAIFEEIDHASLIRNGRSLSTESSDLYKSMIQHNCDHEADAEYGGGFSGLYSIPKTTLNVPNSFTLDKHRSKLVTELPEICYQNHVDLDDITYTFGGVYVNKYCDFRHLGMPIDVDPEKISIHFPCELPPHVDKNILISPYMMQNPHLIIFNAFRSTVSYCDTYSSSDYPAHLNNATGCPISKSHIFFYGGFEINLESVEYIAEIDRWVIKKKLVMNENGYILDIRTLKFTKIKLESKTQDLLRIGRIGNAIAANILELSGEDKEKENRCILPPVFTDINNDLPFPSSPLPKPVNFPELKNPDNIRLPESLDASVLNASNDKSNVSDIDSTPPVSASSSYSFNILKQLNSLKSFAGNSDTSKITPTTSTKSSIIHTTAGPKLTHALSKSSKIFHRHQKQPSGGTLKSPTNHPLKNTYSNQVRDNRSNSQNSRPVSPILIGNPMPKSNSHKTPTNTVNNSVDSKLFQNSNQNDKKKDTFSNLEGDLKQSASLISYVSTNASPSKNESPLNLEDVGFKTADNDNGFSFDSRSKNASFNNHHINNSRERTVSVYIFGGFECHEDEFGYRTFRATNDLLRIDISCKKIKFTIGFENEASISTVGANGIYSKMGESIHSDLWPSPRGYFAYSLIDHNQSIDENCFWDRESLNPSHSESDDLPDDEGFTNRYYRAISPVSDSISSSSTSLQTTSSKGISTRTLRIKTVEDFFNGKALLIQGGCNENFKTFSEFFVFVFETGKWQTLSTYVHDYFNSHKQPYEDDDASIFVKENEVASPKLIEAELRACHHSALYYKNDEKDYLFFIGGFTNDYLRYFDDEPYVSDKFDVSRLSKLQFAPSNSDTLRVMVLNLHTQTWRFLKYYYDVSHSTHENFLKILNSNSAWNNARISNFGGCVSLNGKAITICHGMACAVPEKREDLAKLKLDVPDTSILWGAHVRFSFPSL
mmetsp:Transcript_4489/g.4956  ORF Transcript_4489/g.4956 Transcript_4489/m.4956 type:complete len:1048 (-) Transcript_4489:607-3750(-)